MFFFTSTCKRDDKILIPNKLSLIEESKNYFNQNYLISNNLNSQKVTSEKNPRKGIIKTPLWQSAIIVKKSFGDAVIIPLKHDNNINIKAGTRNQALNLDFNSYLMMYKNANLEMITEVVTWIPDKEYWDDENRKKKRFVGQVIVENWFGEISKGFYFNKDGKTYPLVKPQKNKVTTLSTTCIRVDWYRCHKDYTFCDFLYSETFCYDIEGGGGPGDGGNGGDYNQIGPSGPCDETSGPPTANSGCPVINDNSEIQAFEVDYKNQMSVSELQIYNSLSRFNQLSYLLNAKEALDAAEYLFPGTTLNGKGDAFRHAYFNMQNALSFGVHLARLLGDAHEDKPGNPAIEKEMDLYNNGKGRQAFLDWKSQHAYDVTMSEYIVGLLLSGELKYINNGQLLFTNQ